MSDTIFKDSEFISKRFSCSCLDHHHILDISVEFFPETVIGDRVEVNFSWSMHSWEMSGWERVKKAVAVMLGREYFDCDISLRNTDIDELTELLEKARKGGR